MTVAIIPARGGSKGIPRKNVKPFHGTPLIAYTIEQAKASSLVDDVYVSTDDEEIASVGREWGATVIDRPDRLATDEASTESALLHAVEQLRADGTDPEFVTLLQCTSPLRRRDDIDETVALVTDGEYDSALSVCPDHSFYWRETDEGAEPVNYDPEQRRRRQELAARYQENGSIYVVSTQLLVDRECRLGGRVGVHVMPETLSFEIDEPADLRLTQAIAERVDFYSGSITT